MVEQVKANTRWSIASYSNKENDDLDNDEGGGLRGRYYPSLPGTENPLLFRVGMSLKDSISHARLLSLFLYLLPPSSNHSCTLYLSFFLFPFLYFSFLLTISLSRTFLLWFVLCLSRNRIYLT
jgi:hypothetical protein